MCDLETCLPGDRNTTHFHPTLFKTNYVLNRSFMPLKLSMKWPCNDRLQCVIKYDETTILKIQTIFVRRGKEVNCENGASKTQSHLTNRRRA